jgi:hypothetical protein
LILHIPAERNGRSASRPEVDEAGRRTFNVVEVTGASFCNSPGIGIGTGSGVGNFKLGKKNWDEGYMSQLRPPTKDAADQRVLKVTIREGDHPELYALHRESDWLREREKYVTRQALQAPPPAERSK